MCCAQRKSEVEIISRNVASARAVLHGELEQLRLFPEAYFLPGRRFPAPLLPITPDARERESVCVSGAAVCNFVHEALIIRIFYVDFLRPEGRLENQNQIDKA